MTRESIVPTEKTENGVHHLSADDLVVDYTNPKANTKSVNPVASKKDSTDADPVKGDDDERAG